MIHQKVLSESRNSPKNSQSKVEPTFSGYYGSFSTKQIEFPESESRISFVDEKKGNLIRPKVLSKQVENVIETSEIVSKRLKSPISTLKVRKISFIGIPFSLEKKHFALDLDESKAIEMSKNRKQEVHKNTIFEKPKFLVECEILDQHLSEYHKENILVTDRKLKAFLCVKKGENWTRWLV